MDYEKIHNLSLELGKKLIEKNPELREWVESKLPELRESEDERLRKLLVWQVHRNIEDETNDLAQSVYDGIKGHDPDLEESIEDWKKCLAYLEKQKEQKPAEKQDYSGLNDLERAILRGFLVAGVENVSVTIIKETAQDCLAHMHAEWSKEDERVLKGILGKIAHDQTYGVSKVEMLSFLKSLRPSWKPSEEQIKALGAAIVFHKNDPQIDMWRSLYDDLQKIR